MASNNVYATRRRTLFNLYAFPDYQSVYKSPPSLTISNCDFEYFVGNYESLINVEYNNLQRITKDISTTDDDGTVETLTYDFFAQNNADKGAKISISSSTFKHSRFCKGLITYRKDWNITNARGSYLNYNHLFSNKKNKDTGSYITISSSTFYNLNWLSSVNALASYGGI